MEHQWTHPQHVDDEFNGKGMWDKEESPEMKEVGTGKTPAMEVESHTTREKKTLVTEERTEPNQQQWVEEE